MTNCHDEKKKKAQADVEAAKAALIDLRNKEAEASRETKGGRGSRCGSI
jgi:hypothetical protein